MSSSHRFAVCLLERLGLDSALAGDLLEERARGRSIFWYCTQVLLAIGIGTGRTILAHKILALRAVATGCAINALWLFLWLKFLPFELTSMPRMSLEAIVSVFIILLTQTATGWVVARTHRAHAIPMVLVFAIWLATWYFISSFPDGKRLLVNSIDQPRFRPYLAWYLLPICSEILGLFVGGLLGARLQACPPSQE
jgi:hypothetical protein